MSLIEILDKAKALGLSTEAMERLIDAEQQMTKDKLDCEERALNRESKSKELEYADSALLSLRKYVFMSQEWQK